MRGAYFTRTFVLPEIFWKAIGVKLPHGFETNLFIHYPSVMEEETNRKNDAYYDLFHRTVLSYKPKEDC